MSQESFEQFRQLVLQDVGLQRRLRETRDSETFMALTLELGAEHGCEFSADDVEQALRTSQRAWVERWIAG